MGIKLRDNVYEEVVELIAEAEIDKSQEKLEEIKDMPKFDEIKEEIVNGEEIRYFTKFKMN